MNIKSVKKSNNIGCVVLLVVSLGFLISAIVLHCIHVNRLDSWLEQSAVICEIDETLEIVTYTYEYEDKTYNIESQFYSSSLKVDDKVIIYLNPNNVADIYVPMQMTVGVVFYIISITILLLVGLLSILYVRKRSWNTKCIEQGTKRLVNVDSFKTIYGGTYSYTFMMVVNYKNKEYISEAFKLDKGVITNVKGTVNLYILDDKHYYIDLNSYQEAEIIKEEI